jgi:hypothetical protein
LSAQKVTGKKFPGPLNSGRAGIFFRPDLMRAENIFRIDPASGAKPPGLGPGSQERLRRSTPSHEILSGPGSA